MSGWQEGLCGDVMMSRVWPAAGVRSECTVFCQNRALTAASAPHRSPRQCASGEMFDATRTPPELLRKHISKKLAGNLISPRHSAS